MGRQKDTEGLSIICAGLGIADEDVNGNFRGYAKTEYCLDNLKDLQRFLRRDDPQRRDVFKQLCKWNTVSRDIVPIIESFQNDKNLVINAVKILVFLTMPVDPLSDDVAQQIEYLWDLKAAVTRNLTIAVVVSLLEEPLSHLELGVFTQEDWKLVQLVLTLFRNILAIMNITAQQKASGSATQFLHLTERFLELMFQENVMDLIVVLAQHVDDPDGYLRQDNLLLLEIFHYIFLGRDPELIAKTSTVNFKDNEDCEKAADSLRAIMVAEDEKRKTFRLRNIECHPQYNGTFIRLAMDGSKMLFIGNPAPASTNGLVKVQKVPRGPMKKVASDNGLLSLQEENVLERLHIFISQFLSAGYNDLMQTVQNDIIKEHQDLQNSDIVIFFQVAQFVTAFHQKKILIRKKLNMETMMHGSNIDNQSLDYVSLDQDLCGPIAATMNEKMYYLVISKWRDCFEGVKITNEYKFLTSAGSLMKCMMRMLDLVLKLLPEDSKECQTTRVLLYKLFYDQTEEGLTQFLLKLFKCFDPHKQPKSDLADLLEIIHYMLQLLENIQADGTLRVSRKVRGRRNNKKEKGQNNLESGEKRETTTAHGNTEPSSQMCDDLGKSTTGSFRELYYVEQEQGVDQDNSIFIPAFATGMPLQYTEQNGGQSAAIDNEVHEKPIDEEYGTGNSSNDDQPATNEVNFNISALVSSFASNTVIHNLCWLLKHYKANSASTNHYVICMLMRFCDGLELSPMLYQLCLLTTFYDILEEQKTSKSKEHSNIVKFLTKFIRKMFKITKSQPLLFVEILFWKTRRECQLINANALMDSIVNLRKDVRNMDRGMNGSSNSGGMGYRSIADALGEDEIDLDLPATNHGHRIEQSSDADEDNVLRTKHSELQKNSMADILNNEIDKDKSEVISTGLQEKQTRRLHKGANFTHEQEAIMITLYEKYKNERHCSRLIAEALDPNEKITPVLVSRKLKQLGLMVIPKNKLIKRKMTSETIGDSAVSGSAACVTNDAIQLGLNERGKNHSLRTSRKRVHAFSKEEELQIKDLYEKFKNHKKCAVMIANSLVPNSMYTAAEVSHKLQNLGLLPRRKRSTPSGKQSEDKQINDMQDDSDEETLLAFRKRSNKKTKLKMHGATASIFSPQKEPPQENVSNDVVLSSLLKNAGAEHKAKSSNEKSEGCVELDNMAIDKTARIEEQFQQGELEDLLDSGDDMSPSDSVPRNMGSRRTLKMVLDSEEDE